MELQRLTALTPTTGRWFAYDALPHNVQKSDILMSAMREHRKTFRFGALHVIEEASEEQVNNQAVQACDTTPFGDVVGLQGEHSGVSSWVHFETAAYQRYKPVCTPQLELAPVEFRQQSTDASNATPFGGAVGLHDDECPGVNNWKDHDACHSCEQAQSSHEWVQWQSYDSHEDCAEMKNWKDSEECPCSGEAWSPEDWSQWQGYYFQKQWTRELKAYGQCDSYGNEDIQWDCFVISDSHQMHLANATEEPHFTIMGDILQNVRTKFKLNSMIGGFGVNGCGLAPHYSGGDHWAYFQVLEKLEDNAINHGPFVIYGGNDAWKAWSYGVRDMTTDDHFNDHLDRTLNLSLIHI